MIAAHPPEPHAARLLVTNGASLFTFGTRKPLIDGAQDAAYSPDGTLIAFARAGDLWLANADGSGQRRLTATPKVVEWGPAWLPSGAAIAYTANVAGSRQIRLLPLPAGPSRRIAVSNEEEYSPTVSPGGKLAFVSTRSGAPVVYTAQSNGSAATAFDTTPPPVPYTEIHDLAWSPDGRELAYDATVADGTATVTVDDGTTQTPLPPGTNPVWSPTGSRIAFTSNGTLLSVAADGTDLRTLTPGTPLDWRVVPAGVPKFPNLVQRPPSGLVLEHTAGGRWLLGFTSMVDNRGPGILWIHATRARGARVMTVRQDVQLAGGGHRIDAASGELKYVNAPPHHHWHFVGFDHYELRSAFAFELRVRDYKSGFCIADHWGTAIGIEHGAPRFLGDCEQYRPEAREVEEGSSVGYTDRYPAFFHGQQLDITKLPAGRYWLVHRANEDFHLRERSYSDDAASLLIRLTWRGGAPSVATLRTCWQERC